MGMSQTAKTAISRRSMSAPAQRLRKLDLIRGRVLDYGCGQGKDVEELGCAGYDPHFSPKMPRGRFDTILCTYVLNVLPEDEAQTVVEDVVSRLKPGGRAFFSVRRDMTGCADIQRLVTLDLPVEVEKKGRFCIYRAEAPK